jgi:hypothetical protein
MKRVIKILILLFVSALLGFSYGFLVHRNQIFPYKQIVRAHMKLIYRNDMQWSIGVYQGPDPFHLSDPDEIDNPVFTARDVSDVNAAFVADPFMVEAEGKYYLFFEVMNLNTNTGDIGVALSDNGKEWTYSSIVVDEPFHLSYPSVFQWDGDYYMIPESYQDSSVRLYRATSFPDSWEYLGNLLDGGQYVDPTTFFYNDKWWMFTTNYGNSLLNLYFSDSLESGWQAHPMNPLIANNSSIIRPAGRVFEFENKLFRLIQDDYPYYGIQVYASEIVELSTESYQEKVDTLNTVVTMTGEGWNAAGMHQVDLHKNDDGWLAIVDGLKRRSKRNINE